MSRDSTAPPETTVILNPKSGDADHRDAVRDRAAVLGYAVRETAHAGHAVELAEAAVEDGVARVVAAGGDGTLNEVVRGVLGAGGLEDVTLGVVPVGTGNDFAENVGVHDVDEAFRVVADGERRRLDLGMANGRPFVNSCVAGLTADASGETPDDLKSQLGVLAYAITALRRAATYSGLDVSAAVRGDDGDTETVWSGTAVVVLVGNGRRFGHRGSSQANVEDGLLDVTIVEEAPKTALLEERLGERLFDRDADHITRLLASSLDLAIAGGEPTNFSLDGEMDTFETVSLATEHRAMRFAVGPDYEPTPPVD